MRKSALVECAITHVQAAPKQRGRNTAVWEGRRDKLSLVEYSNHVAT